MLFDLARNHGAHALPAVSLALAASLASCVPARKAPNPFRSPWYQSAFRQINEAGSRAAAGEGPLRAGWSRARIQVPVGVPLAGYGDRNGAPHEGTRDPVYVRAFALQAGEHRIVLLTSDLLLLHPQIVSRVRAKMASTISPDALFFTASHTHSGPGGYVDGLIWELVMGPDLDASRRAVVDAHVAAATHALSDLEPAKVGFGSAHAGGLVHNRVEKDGPTDDRVFVMRLDKSSGKSAALWSFGCHAVTLPPENLAVSSDYPGAIANALEGQMLEVVGFAAGGVGSSNPKKEGQDVAWLTDPLEAAVRRALHRAEKDARSWTAISSARANLEVPPLSYRAGDLALWGEILPPLISMPTIEFGAIAINDRKVMLHLPGEISGTLTRAVHHQSLRQGVDVEMFPFNGTYVGYLVSKRVFDLPAEAGADMLDYERETMSFLGPHGADLVLTLGIRLGAAVHHRARHRFEQKNRIDSAAVDPR